MAHCFSITAMMIAVIVLNIIAMIAMIIAHFEIRRALREIDKFSEFFRKF